MTEGKMTAQDRARLEAWHMQEIDTALDTPDLAVPMAAITRAESYGLDTLTAYIAGDVAEKARAGMTEAQWYSSPNRLLQGVLTMEGIAPRRRTRTYPRRRRNPQTARAMAVGLEKATRHVSEWPRRLVAVIVADILAVFAYPHVAHAVAPQDRQMAGIRVVRIIHRCTVTLAPIGRWLTRWFVAVDQVPARRRCLPPNDEAHRPRDFTHRCIFTEQGQCFKCRKCDDLLRFFVFREGKAEVAPVDHARDLGVADQPIRNNFGIALAGLVMGATRREYNRCEHVKTLLCMFVAAGVIAPAAF